MERNSELERERKRSGAAPRQVATVRRRAALALGAAALGVLSIRCTLLLPLDEFTAGNDAGADSSADADASGCDAGLTACGNVCVDLKNDDMHCGACDIACKASGCKSAVCQPFSASTNGVLPAGIVFDGTYVTWVVTTTAPGETSYVYRLKPDDFVAGLDGSAAASRTLGSVTATHIAQNAGGYLFYSTEDRLGDAGNPSAVRFLRFEVSGSKTLGQLGPGESVGGLALRDTDAGTNVSWIAEGAPKGALGMHFGTLVDGGGNEINGAAATIPFTFNNGSKIVDLGNAGAALPGAGSQLFFVASDDTSAWVVERLGTGLDGQWDASSTKVSSARRIRGMTYDGQQQLFYVVDNEIWQTTASLSGASKTATIGSTGDVLYAITADADDIYVLSALGGEPTKGRVIRKRRGGGGDVTTVGTAGLAGDGAILLTKDWLFWVSDGALRFLPRP